MSRVWAADTARVEGGEVDLRVGLSTVLVGFVKKGRKNWIRGEFEIFNNQIFDK